MTDDNDPFAEIEQLFEQFTDVGTSFAQEIPVDMIDAEDALIVHADLPGRDSETIDVQLRNDGNLQIEAAAADDESPGQYLRRERTAERVERSIRLPEVVDESATDASYDRGVLTVRLPKPDDEGPGTEIPVE
jgi:HSP20 family protein